MFINFKKLKHLTVYTKSGETLGKIHDVSFDLTGHTVSEYLVKNSYLSSRELLIKPGQILEITKDKVIVEDGVLKNFMTSGLPVLSS